MFANQCHSRDLGVKVMERSSSTFPQTHIFFVPYIQGLAQTVLTWEAKVVAVADAAAAAAETNWNHKVTPDWGDLIRRYDIVQCKTIYIWIVYVYIYIEDGQ